MRRRRFLKVAGVFVPAFPAIVKAQVAPGRRAGFFKGPSGAASGPNQWYDLQASPGNANDATNSTTLFFSSLAPGGTGTCTKLRIWCVNTALGNVKMGLWNNDRSMIVGATGVAAVAGTGQYTEVTLGTPAAVTSGTPYWIAWESDNTPGWGYDNTSGTLFFDNTGNYSYTTWPGSTPWGGTVLPAGSSVGNRNHCISMFVA